jgi:hypothetical protein
MKQSEERPQLNHNGAEFFRRIHLIHVKEEVRNFYVVKSNFSL